MGGKPGLPKPKRTLPSLPSHAGEALEVRSRSAPEAAGTAGRSVLGRDPRGTPPCGAAAKTAALPPLPRVPGGVPHSCRHMQGPQARVSEPVALAGRPPCSSQGRELSVFGPGHIALATQLLSGEKPEPCRVLRSGSQATALGHTHLHSAGGSGPPGERISYQMKP